jgi:hypothetical protein
LAVNWHNTRTATDISGQVLEEGGRDAAGTEFPVDMGADLACVYIQYHA